MKLSQFKGTNIRKKLQFINGELQEVIASEQINGDINFYSLDIDKLEVINNEVIGKLDESDSSELLMYKIIPYITDVECDVTFDEFMMMIKSPSNSFMAFSQEIITSINEMFSTIGELSKVIETSTELSNAIIAEDGNSVNTEVEEVKDKVENNVSEETDLDKEALLDNLYEQLGKTSDRENRKKLIKRITDLQKS